MSDPTLLACVFFFFFLVLSVDFLDMNLPSLQRAYAMVFRLQINV